MSRSFERDFLRTVGSVAAIFLLVIGLGTHAPAQTIVSVSPPSVQAGSPGFTLTVTGSGFNTSSLVQINGSSRPTVFVSALQLKANIFASDVASPGTLLVTVFTRLPTGAGVTSNSVGLSVSTAPGPSLTSVSPGFVPQGGNRVRMTLIGANFRPGATVVISPPLAALSDSSGRTRAADMAVLSVLVVNANLMTALINVSPTAAAGLRAVDVLNLDGSSTAGSIASGAGGTSQPLRVEPFNSLGAPLSVLNMALIYPRDGTAVAQGQELIAEAVLGGTGTGTVIGQWLWDGNVVEQFSVSIVGGQSASVRTHQPLPTFLLGSHTLQLRMVQPNQIASRPIIVVVNSGDWKPGQLIEPASGAAFGTDESPRLLWAPVPGAAKYQVGFSTEPDLGSIHEWFDVTDNSWEIPDQLWQEQPEGEFYWTVRAVDSSGAWRKPLPMRSIYRVPQGGLTSARPTPSHTAAGNTLLEWKPAQKSGFYFVTISSDLEATHVIRQYLTADPKLDLRAVDQKLTPGTTYYWRVDAIARNGRLIFSGPPQSFIADALPKTSLKLERPRVMLASLANPPSLPYSPDLAAQIAARTPTPDSIISQQQPTISVSFQPPVNPSDVSLMVDDVDITSLAQLSEIKIAFTPPLLLSGGDHNVNLTVGSQATAWKFTVNAPATVATSPQAGTDAEALPKTSGSLPATSAINAAHHPAQATKPTRPSEEGQLSSNTQWTSGSNPPDTNVLSISQRMIFEEGPWHVEFNGSGLLNSVLNPEVQRTSQGRFSDYVFQLGYKKKNWGINLRFGTVSPSLYTDAQFVTAAVPRQGAEVMLKTPGGSFGFFANTNDEAPGGGAGINFHQQMLGASWQAPLPKWAIFRLMWLSAQDIGAPTTVSFDSQGNPINLPNPVASKSSGDVYGALLNIHLTQKWLWSSEYAFSRDNANTADPASRREFGRAWRTGISGQTGKTNVNVAYRDVSQNFGNPANPSLTQSSQPDLRGVDSAVTQGTKAGTFGVNYTFLANNVHPTTSDELLMDSFDETWSKPFAKKTNVSVDARQSLTQTGTVPDALQGMPPDQTGAQDQRDISGSLNASRQIGTVTVTLGGARDWNHNNLLATASTITSALNLGTNLVTRGFFQLNSQASVNWVAADGLTVGTTRTITVYIQPAFNWKKPKLQVSPLATLTKGRTILVNGMLTSDMLTGQYGGRVSWTLPGVLKFSTFAAQGSYNQNHNELMSIDQNTTQLLVLWTATWSHKHTF